jgi:hypothetical protein
VNSIDLAVVDIAKGIYPGVNDETEVVWVKKRDKVALESGEVVEMNGKIGDQYEGYWIGYGPESNCIVACRSSGRWEERDGYDLWVGPDDTASVIA